MIPRGGTPEHEGPSVPLEHAGLTRSAVACRPLCSIRACRLNKVCFFRKHMLTSQGRECVMPRGGTSEQEGPSVLSEHAGRTRSASSGSTC
eukprot:1160067-Pelagomonas_calceolata.AAC.9